MMKVVTEIAIVTRISVETPWPRRGKAETCGVSMNSQV